MARLSVFIIALFLALLPATGYAQVNEASGDGFVMRIEGDLTVREDDSIDAAVVIDGDVRVDGTIEDFLIVIDGYAEITGRVNGQVFTIASDIDLREDAVVDGDIDMIESDLRQEAGSEVTGDIDDDISINWWQWLLLNVVVWVGMTIAVLVFGLLLVAVAPRQAAAAGAAMTADAGWSILAAAITFIGVPILAIIALVTVIGLPLGIGVLAFVLPALWFVGYLVAGLMLGTLIFSRSGEGLRENRYLAVLAGLGILQFVLLIPFLGILIAVLSGLWGGGAIALLAWRSFRAPRAAGPPMPA